MIRLHRRGVQWHVDFFAGSDRLRGSLGTKSKEASARLKGRLENALAEGPTSVIWRELKPVLPKSTFARFSTYSGVRSDNSPTWERLESIFRTHLNQRVSLGKLSPNTRTRYLVLLGQFSDFLEKKGINDLHEITRPLVEEFKTVRLADISKKKTARGGGGLVLDVAILHRVFAIGVEHELLTKNPVKMEGRPGANPQQGAEPFSPEELAKLREHAGLDRDLLLLLRWTGLRGSDVVGLCWSGVNWDTLEIHRKTKKRGKHVVIPMQDELVQSLKRLHEERKPKPTDHVALNPKTNKPMGRPVLYNRMVELGKRAGVPRVHPHRFRDTLAVDMLARGAGLYDVAKILGDTQATVERHYTPFVPTLRDRVRGLLNNGRGLESPENGRDGRESHQRRFDVTS